MAILALGDSEFPLGPCARCTQDVLPYVDFDSDGAEGYRCIHCDTPMTGVDLRPASSGEIEAAGYALVTARGCCNGGGCSSGCGLRPRAQGVG